MSTTSASCCCDKQPPVKIANAYEIKGSGCDYGGAPIYNAPALNLYLTAIDSCKPCKIGRAHV